MSGALGVSVRRDGNGYSFGADANVMGVLPSVSITVTEMGTLVDANVWSPKFGQDGKLRATGSIADIGGANLVKIGLRIDL
ncbi:MAG: hypothetical protein V1909_04270 [Candidatus Micrarchaeota archaeon]